ncbi:pre-rRNA-processing protein TSR2 homolog [Corythoichthys intestinalis]|uniref:pre-rRNA-processing protein TSR2 homolog n=1 Tax=Corythoichthys intestinalis TaxID=161448 RepID=UPI0025A4CD65|nr:pre-rRNA-processing protein TSR2 homolog [Corythoichthys intestinalis]
MAASAAHSRALFTDGVRATLHSWPVLQIALDNGFGGVYGQQKADWLVDVVQQYFHDNADLQQDEVEDFLCTLMDQEFDTVVEDGSLPQVCLRLIQMFSQWQQGALQQLSHSIQLLTHKQTARVKVTAPPDSDSDGDEQTQAMEFENATDSASDQQIRGAPQEDQDGWTLVGKRK